MAVSKTRKPAKKAASSRSGKSAGKRMNKNTATIRKVASAQPAATKPVANTNFKTMETIMKQNQQFEKLAQDAGKSGKESMEAVIRSSSIAMKGMEDLVKTCMEMAQSSTEKNTQAFQSLLGSKTLNEFTEAQSRFVQDAFDNFMSGATRLSELSVKLATEAFEPINDQVSKTMRTVTAVAA